MGMAVAAASMVVALLASACAAAPEQTHLVNNGNNISMQTYMTASQWADWQKLWSGGYLALSEEAGLTKPGDPPGTPGMAETTVLYHNSVVRVTSGFATSTIYFTVSMTQWMRRHYTTIVDDVAKLGMPASVKQLIKIARNEMNDDITAALTRSPDGCVEAKFVGGIESGTAGAVVFAPYLRVIGNVEYANSQCYPGTATPGEG